jgi:hypothetical protein
MEGDLKVFPLTEVLELIHAHRRSGVLEVREGVLPLTLRFAAGEVVGAASWTGRASRPSSPSPSTPRRGLPLPARPPAGERPLMPFANLLGEWARVNDEWDRFRALIDSPSRVLEAIRPKPPLEPFQGGKSVRAAAKTWGVPLLIAMERAYMGLREGDLYPLRRYAWYALRIRHQGKRGKTLEEFGGLQGLLDGTRNLGEVIAQGVPEALVRRYLVQALASGELAPPGRGWLLRDLTWEMEKEGA